MSLPRGSVITGIWIVVFVACIAFANWSLLHIGLDNGPGRPRTIPLGLGWEAPSGVIFAGVLLTVRDVIHERIGQIGTLAVIVASAPLTAVTSNKSIAVASVVTFLLAETVDLAIYSALRCRGRTRAVVVSNVVSGLLDSCVFLIVAFGLESAVHGAAPMTLGKVAASLVTVVVIDSTRRGLAWAGRDQRAGDLVTGLTRAAALPDSSSTRSDSGADPNGRRESPGPTDAAQASSPFGA